MNHIAKPTIFDHLAHLSVRLLGFDVFCLNKKFLVLNLVDRNLKIKYRRSYLGFFWTILSPLAMSSIYYFVFKVVMKVDRPHYLAFIICGVLPWSFFAQTINESVEAIVGNAGLLTKIPIPIHVFPYVTTITNFSTLVFAVPVIFISAILSDTPFTLNSLWIFYFFFLLMLMSYSIGSILAILFVYFRDLKHAIGLALQLWIYGTPIFYDSSMIPEKYKFILYLNPVGPIFEGIHVSFINGHIPSQELIYSGLVWCVILFLTLRVVYSNLKPGLVERI